MDFPKGADFYEQLLWDYSNGIRHNNRETSYRYILLNRVTNWMTLGILMFVGLILNVIVRAPDWAEIGSLAVAAVFAAILLRSSIVWTCRLERRDDDPSRFGYDDYGRAHDVHGQRTESFYHEWIKNGICRCVVGSCESDDE